MNLSFSTVFPGNKKGLSGKPTLFVEKILHGLDRFNLTGFFEWNEVFLEAYKEGYLLKEYKDGVLFEDDYDGKIHTIRGKGKRKWNEKKIHFRIWTGKPYVTPTFLFAPIIPCTGTEDIFVIHPDNENDQFKPYVMIGDKYLWNDSPEMKELAINDGFDSVDDFFLWFDEYFEGEIIHWTKRRYDNENVVVDESEEVV